MPQVKKQAAPAPKSPPVSYQLGMKTCIYGRGKTGKTRFACTWPHRILIIGGELGWKSVATALNEADHRFKLSTGNKVIRLLNRGVDTGIDYCRIRSSVEMDELTTIASENYPSGLLDTGGGLQDIIIKEVGGFNEVPVQKSWGLLKQEQWGVVNSQWKERVFRFLDLADRSPFHATIIAHERDFGKENAGQIDPELIAPDIGPDLTPGSSRWLNGACDYVVNMFKRQGTVMQMIEGLSEPQPIRTGKPEYCLRIEGGGVYTTGFRCCLPPGETLPDVIVDPTFEKLRKFID